MATSMRQYRRAFAIEVMRLPVMFSQDEKSAFKKLLSCSGTHDRRVRTTRWIFNRVRSSVRYAAKTLPAGRDSSATVVVVVVEKDRRPGSIEIFVWTYVVRGIRLTRVRVDWGLNKKKKTLLILLLLVRNAMYS